MKYTQKSFTVPASGKREGECRHEWLDSKGNCVLCGHRDEKQDVPLPPIHNAMDFRRNFGLLMQSAMEWDFPEVTIDRKPPEP